MKWIVCGAMLSAVFATGVPAAAPDALEAEGGPWQLKESHPKIRAALDFAGISRVPDAPQLDALLRSGDMRSKRIYESIADNADRCMNLCKESTAVLAKSCTREQYYGCLSGLTRDMQSIEYARKCTTEGQPPQDVERCVSRMVSGAVRHVYERVGLDNEASSCVNFPAEGEFAVGAIDRMAKYPYSVLNSSPQNATKRICQEEVGRLMDEIEKDEIRRRQAEISAKEDSARRAAREEADKKAEEARLEADSRLRTADLRAGRVAPDNAKEYVIASRAQDGSSIGANPKIKPDGVMYASWCNVIAYSERTHEIDCGIDSYSILNMVRVPPRRFILRAQGEILKRFEANANIGDAVWFTGWYVQNYASASLRKTVPIIMTVDMVVSKKGCGTVLC